MSDWIANKTGATGQVVTLFEIASLSTGFSLQSAINDSVTSGILVVLPSGSALTIYPHVNDVVQIDDEDMIVTSVSGSVGAGYTLTVARAWGGTTAVAHSAGATVRVWRDFGNLLPNASADRHRILSLPTISRTAEKDLNTITSSISSLVVSNLDGQWNNPAWFGTWSDRLVRFYWATPEEDRAGEGTASPRYYMTALGTFAIEEVTCERDFATIKLVSLDVRLREASSAESVRDAGWFQARPTKWLLERLLGSQYHGAKESPPKYWTADIPDNLEQETRGTRAVFSNYGRVPEWDGTNWLTTDDICRALCLDKDGNNLIYGVGDTVYRRDLSTLTDTSLGIPTGATGYKIVQLWRPSQGSAIAYGIAMRPRTEASGSTWFGIPADEVGMRQLMIPFKVNSNYTLTAWASQSCFGGYHVLTGLPYSTGAGLNHTHDEGLPVPFAQKIATESDYADTWTCRVSTGPDAADYAASHINHTSATGMSAWYGDTNLYQNLFSDLGGSIQPGYRFLTSSEYSIARHSMGQRGAFAYNKYFSTAGAIYWMKPITAGFGGAGGAIYYRLNRIDCATGTIKECTDNSIAVAMDQVDLYSAICDVPTAMTTAWTGSAVQVFVATHRTVTETDTSYETSDNRIRRYLDTAVGSVPTLDATIFDNDAQSEIQTWRYYTILEMSPGPGGYIHMVGLVRGSAQMYAGSSWYRSARILSTASAGTNPTAVQGPYGVPTLASQLCGLYYDDTVTDQNYRLWAVDGAGLLLRWSETGTRWEVEPSLTSMVLDEPYCTGALATKIQNTTPPTLEIYGVSAPLPSWFCDRTDDAAITYTHPDGKYYLWKVARTIADRFPLADFSGWSVWEAIGKIAAATRHTAYFDGRGRFRFEEIQAPNASGADYGVSAVDSHTDYLFAPWIKRPSLGHGNKEIYNTATAVPYDTVISAPSSPRLALTAGSDLLREDAEGNVHPPSIEISCKSIYPVRVLLRCVSGGRLLATADARRPVFRKEIDAPKTSLILTQQASGGTLYVDHIPINDAGVVSFAYGDADTGDYVTIGTTDYWDASQRRITGYSLTASTLTVDPVVNSTNDGDGYPYPAGTPVTIFERLAADEAEAGTSYAFASGVPRYVGNGITVKMTAGVSSLADEPHFAVGDTLVIETNGLKLEKAERSIQSVVSVPSIRSGYGKREAKIEDNRLLTKATALELARWTVDSYRYPHFVLSKGTWRLIPWLDPLTTLHLRDPVLFPSSAVSGLPARTERVYVRSVSHDMRRLQTTVDLRGTRDLT